MNKNNFPCGFECKFPNIESVWDFFDFSNIDFGKRTFTVVDYIVYSKGKWIEVPSVFPPDYFKELIRKSFVAEAFVLHLYPNVSPQEEIDNYQDYLKSPCEMIVLLYDCYYMEIYCKNHSLLKSLIKAAKKNPLSVIELKYEDTDPRTEMYV